MSTQKKLEDYEYKISIQEVTLDGNVTLLFSEVDGADGFGVTVSQDQLLKMKEDGSFDEWAEEQIKKRLDLLREARERERKREEMKKKKMKDLEEFLKEKKIRVKRSREK